MVKEYNNLADKSNKLVEDKEALEHKNRDKAYEVINQQKPNRYSDCLICEIRYNDTIKFELGADCNE